MFGRLSLVQPLVDFGTLALAGFHLRAFVAAFGLDVELEFVQLAECDWHCIGRACCLVRGLGSMHLKYPSTGLFFLCFETLISWVATYSAQRQRGGHVECLVSFSCFFFRWPLQVPASV